MFVYYLLILLCFGAVIFTGKKYALVNDDGVGLNKNQKIWFCAIIIYMIFLCAFRAYGRIYYIGIDTYGYYENYIQIDKSFNSISAIINSHGKDIGYKIVIWVLKKLHFDFTIALTLFSLAYVGIVGIYIYKYSKNMIVSIIVFASLGLYTFAFSAIRQSIAMGLCLAAYMLDDKYKGIKGFVYFVLFVAAAFKIHTSAVVFAPAYVIGKLPYRRSTIFVFMGIAAATMAFKGQFANFIMRLGADVAEHYEGYGSSVLVKERNAGMRLYMLVAALITLRLIFSKKISNNARNDSLIYMMLFMLILFPATQGGGAMMRIYYYYYIFIITFVPNTVENIKEHRDRIIIYTFLIAFFMYFFYSTLSNKTLMITPYRFFWQ